MKKKNIIALIIGCFLIFSNIGIAVSVTDFSVSKTKSSLSEDLTKEPVEKTDIVLIEKETVKSNEEIVAEENIIYSHNDAFKNANAGGPYSGESEETITFYGSSCFNTATYEWDFGDPNDQTPGYGKHPTHSYSAPGTYYAILTITKDKDEIYQDIAPVFIDQEGDHLIPYGGCNYEAEADESILFDGSQSSSNGEDIVEWIWHFGDGTVGYGEQVSHSYKKEKVYLVTFEVKDSNGNTRQDVLHADIGCTYSSIWDFFINTDGIVGKILELISNTQISGDKICELLKIKMYTKYDDGVEETTNTVDINNFNDFPLYIDVNLDGDDDVVVNNIKFFRPVISTSPFNNFPWFAFESTLSNIQLTGGSDITTDDDFTICLQFSLEALQDFLGIQEPLVRVGYNSPAGEEKPNNFKFTHIFRPYFLFRLFSGGNQQQYQQQNMNTITYPIEESNTYTQSSQQQTMQQSGTGTVSLPLTYSGEGSSPAPLGGTGDISEEEQELENQLCNGESNSEYSGAIITENGVRVESSNVDSFSLLASFSNTAETTRTTLKITFDSFTTSTLMHRKGQTYQDVDFQGANANSGMTLSVTRESQYGTATLGIKVDPIQNFGFGIDIYRLANDARHIGFKIDNPPENIILFKESENTQGEQDKHYFYLKHLPASIDLEWLPHLYDGYFELSKDDPNKELEIGVCDDLEDPYMNVYMSNLPTQTTLRWQILYETPKSITLISDTQGVTLNAELKNVTQPNQEINFQAISNEGLDIKFLWSIPNGFFELQRSTRNIDFNFLISQEISSLEVTGNFRGGGDDDGFIIYFYGLEQGLIHVVNDIALDMTVNAINHVTETTLLSDVEFTTGGEITIQWERSLNLGVDVTASLGLHNLMLSNPQDYLSAQDIVLSAGCRFALNLGMNNQVQLGASGQVSIVDLEGEFGSWSGSITSATAGGSFGIILKPLDKYYELDTSSSFTVEGFNFEYDDPDEEQYDFILEFDSFNMFSEGTTWFDFSGAKPKFTLDGKDDVELTNFHLLVGSGSASAIDFTISNAHVYQAGTIYGVWDSSSFYIDATVDFNWDIDIDTLNFGSWEAQGNLDGSASIDAGWTDGSGSIELVIGESGILNSLEIIHDDLTLNLGSFSFDAGTITFEWERENSPDPGEFNILNNGVDGDLTLCKISYTDPQNPIEIELGDIDFESGNIYVDWKRTSNMKYIHIDSETSVDVDPLKITWGSKILTLEALELKPGEFKFTWDPTVYKLVQIKNGIQSLGPGVTYENLDDDLKISASVMNLRHDYTKTIELRWYNDQDYKGLYLDTGGQQLADLVTFEVVKGDFGRKIALSGLQADDFIIRKDLNTDKMDLRGKIYLVNGLTYSKLVNEEWKDLEITWNLDGDGVGYIEFDIDSSFEDDWNIDNVYLKGVKISANIDDLAEYVKFAWDVDFDLQGYIKIDTNNESIAEIGITIQKDASGYYPKWGVYLHASSMAAEDFEIIWDFSKPPGQWVLTTNGWIEPGSLDTLWIAWKGNWYNVLGNGSPAG